MGDQNLDQDSKGKAVLVYDDQEESVQYNVPIGFKFAPSDDELISFFLKNKIAYPGEFNPPGIPVKNIYEHLPQELLEGNKDKDAYFFTARNKRHAKGPRVNRSVKEGYGHWRMTGSGKAKEIKGVDGSVIGYKNSLKFYTGKNKTDGKGTDWLMNEYVMKEKVGCSSMNLDDWVICQVHLRKNGNSSCNNKQKMESERKRGRGHEGIEIGDHEDVRMSADVPRTLHHQEHEDQFASYNPQFGANNLQYSEMSSNAIHTIQHHQENHFQLGGYSGMIHQQQY